MSRAWGVEYYIRRLGPACCEVAKFDGTEAPAETYTVRWETCTCFVGWNCKHVRLVQQWVQLGEPPAVFWNEGDVWRHEKIPLLHQ
jgi:hypothetical protein